VPAVVQAAPDLGTAFQEPAPLNPPLDLDRNLGHAPIRDPSLSLAAVLGRTPDETAFLLHSSLPLVTAAPTARIREIRG
jgi:hypothetical protein